MVACPPPSPPPHHVSTTELRNHISVATTKDKQTVLVDHCCNLLKHHWNTKQSEGKQASCKLWLNADDGDKNVWKLKQFSLRSSCSAHGTVLYE